MALLGRKLLHAFTEEKPKDLLTIEVPTGSKLVDVKVLHDGIYIWFEMPQIDTGSMTTKRYRILTGIEPIIPTDGKFLAMPDTVVENEQGQHVIVFPIYELP